MAPNSAPYSLSTMMGRRGALHLAYLPHALALSGLLARVPGSCWCLSQGAMRLCSLQNLLFLYRVSPYSYLPVSSEAFCRPAAVRETLSVFPPDVRSITIKPWVSRRRRL